MLQRLAYGVLAELSNPLRQDPTPEFGFQAVHIGDPDRPVQKHAGERLRPKMPGRLSSFRQGGQTGGEVKHFIRPCKRPFEDLQEWLGQERRWKVLKDQKTIGGIGHSLRNRCGTPTSPFKEFRLFEPPAV